MFVTLLLTGITTAIILFVAFALLIEKFPRWLKQLVFGHYLLSDILFTGLSFIAFPVVGLATLVTAGVFCILITLYLMGRRKTQPYARIETGGPTLIRVVKYNLDSNK